jgi:phosphatidylserine/phosphatidylglycerophosphate/cardiolipin synthase-like enzyme
MSLLDRRVVIAVFIFGLLLGATLGVIYARYGQSYLPPSSPPTYDVYFSPKGGCAEAVIYWISRANRSVHVLMYIFTLDTIADALISAHKRGVEVMVVLDKSQSYGQFAVLKDAGIKVRNDTNWEGILHDKIAIIDGTIVLTGSFNWTTTAENNNNENLIVIRRFKLRRPHQLAHTIGGRTTKISSWILAKTLAHFLGADELTLGQHQRWYFMNPFLETRHEQYRMGSGGLR